MFIFKNSLDIKQSQGPLDTPQGSQIIPWAMSFVLFVDTETPSRWKKLTTGWPDCSHDLSCHDPENWCQNK